MFKRILMVILDLLFRAKSESISRSKIKDIIIIRTDERLGEIILTLPLINYLRSALNGAKITFLMCKRYEGLSRYIDCDGFLFFEKRELFLHPLRFIDFLKKLRSHYFDLAILGGKIEVPSLTSYLLLGFIRSRYKAAIKQRGFNPFVNLPVEVDTISEPLSKYEMGKRIIGIDLSFSNLLRVEGDIDKVYDVMIFTDARKSDHLIPTETIKDILIEIKSQTLKVVLVSGKEEEKRIYEIKDGLSFEVDLFLSPGLDELIKIIRMSRCVIVANTGVMHLSVALRVPTCGIFVNADPSIWGYNYEPHFMVDAREKEVDINEIVNFVLCSIKRC